MSGTISGLISPKLHMSLFFRYRFTNIVYPRRVVVLRFLPVGRSPPPEEGETLVEGVGPGSRVHGLASFHHLRIHETLVFHRRVIFSSFCALLYHRVCHLVAHGAPPGFFRDSPARGKATAALLDAKTAPFSHPPRPILSKEIYEEVPFTATCALDPLSMGRENTRRKQLRAQRDQNRALARAKHRDAARAALARRDAEEEDLPPKDEEEEEKEEGEEYRRGSAPPDYDPSMAGDDVGDAGIRKEGRREDVLLPAPAPAPPRSTSPPPTTAVAVAAHARLSKSEMRKLRQIETKKRKDAEREAIMARLQATAVPDTDLLMLRSSGKGTRKETRREEVARALAIERADLNPKDHAELVARLGLYRHVSNKMKRRQKVDNNDDDDDDDDEEEDEEEVQEEDAGDDDEGEEDEVVAREGRGSDPRETEEGREDDDPASGWMADLENVGLGAKTIAALSELTRHLPRRRRSDGHDHDHDEDEDQDHTVEVSSKTNSSARAALRALRAHLRREAGADAAERAEEAELVSHLVAGGRSLDDDLRIQRHVSLPRPSDVVEARGHLPVVGMEREIMEAIYGSDVVVLSGATGSGKTTQVPQFLLEAGFGCRAYPERRGRIGVTQPRRVAATSTAARVAYEVGEEGGRVGGRVGYHIRHDKRVRHDHEVENHKKGKNGRKGGLGEEGREGEEEGEGGMEGNRSTASTSVVFMTDGIMLREAQDDLLLQRYSAVILDEAHERR